MNLSVLFPDEDFRFSMRFERGEIATFFQATSRRSEIIRQRRHLLASAPFVYAGLQPGATPQLSETIDLARSLGATPENLGVEHGETSAWNKCLALGAHWEPDFLILKPGATGEFHLCGGCVCFPSSWSLDAEMGKTVGSIHSVVPGLNRVLEKRIHRFLQKLRPGFSWERYNWGFSSSPELNQHPCRGIPQIDNTVSLDEAWLRIERQSLVALPRSTGVLFSIRLEVRRLDEVRDDPTTSARLTRALRTMPEAVARYKKIAAARGTIIELLSR